MAKLLNVDPLAPAAEKPKQGLVSSTYPWRFSLTSTAHSILQQEYTWGHILISLEAFHSLLIALSVFTPFVDYVLAFGLKVSENDENLVGYHCRTSSIASGEQLDRKNVAVAATSLNWELMYTCSRDLLQPTLPRQEWKEHRTSMVYSTRCRLSKVQP